MENSTFHTVMLFSGFAKTNFGWLQRFVFYSESKHLYVFPCDSYQILGNGFVEFKALLKSAKERVRVLLPIQSIAGILDGDLHKNQLGFLYQENNRNTTKNPIGE